MILCLDKDGTLVYPRSGGKFVSRYNDQEIYTGVWGCLEYARDRDVDVAICSNQAGIAAGHKTLADTIDEMNYCLNLLPGLIYAVYFCPDWQGMECYHIDGATREVTKPSDYFGYYRKPNIGMIRQAEKDLDLSAIALVGDRVEDLNAAINAEILFWDAEEWRTDINHIAHRLTPSSPDIEATWVLSTP